MIFIALFFPSVISIALQYKMKKSEWNIFNYISRYIIDCIFNILISQGIVQYVLYDDVITIDSYDRFFFFTKYMIMACGFAIIIPVILNIAGRYISIKIKLEDRNEKK